MSSYYAVKSGKSFTRENLFRYSNCGIEHAVHARRAAGVLRTGRRDGVVVSGRAGEGPGAGQWRRVPWELFQLGAVQLSVPSLVVRSANRQRTEQAETAGKPVEYLYLYSVGG